MNFFGIKSVSRQGLCILVDLILVKLFRKDGQFCIGVFGFSLRIYTDKEDWYEDLFITHREFINKLPTPPPPLPLVYFRTRFF